jgi:hypothetical protein
MRANRRWRQIVLAALALGAALSVAGVVSSPVQQAFAYLAAFGFLASSMVGALSLLAMTSVVGARWMVVLRRSCLAVAAPTSILPVLFFPIAWMLHSIYPWAGSPLAGEDTIAAARRAQAFGRPWMSAGPYLLRSALYLVVWFAIAEALRHAARAQDRGQRSWWVERGAAVSAAALPALGLTGSWAAFDWLMSAVPGWNMTSVGLYVLTGGFASALGLLAVVVDHARRQGLVPPEVGAAHSLALGRLLFSAVCLWAYIAVSQLIIVWIANLPHEASFYVPRARGGFRHLAALLTLGHFVVPFLLLLSRRWKEHSGFVAVVGGWIVIMHAVDLYWLIAPTAAASPSVFALGPFLLLSAFALSAGLFRSSIYKPLPMRDPELARSLGYESP